MRQFVGNKVMPDRIQLLLPSLQRNQVTCVLGVGQGHTGRTGRQLEIGLREVRLDVFLCNEITTLVRRRQVGKKVCHQGDLRIERLWPPF
jgi:hypothetical protein